MNISKAILATLLSLPLAQSAMSAPTFNETGEIKTMNSRSLVGADEVFPGFCLKYIQESEMFPDLTAVFTDDHSSSGPFFTLYAMVPDYPADNRRFSKNAFRDCVWGNKQPGAFALIYDSVNFISEELITLPIGHQYTKYVLDIKFVGLKQVFKAMTIRVRNGIGSDIDEVSPALLDAVLKSKRTKNPAKVSNAGLLSDVSL